MRGLSSLEFLVCNVTSNSFLTDSAGRRRYPGKDFKRPAPSQACNSPAFLALEAIVLQGIKDTDPLVNPELRGLGSSTALSRS